MTARDDGSMDRFERNARRFTARDAVVCMLVAAVVLVVVQGSSMPSTGRAMKPGVSKNVVLALAHPAKAISDSLPLHTAALQLTKPLSPDAELSATGGFGRTAAAGGVPVVTADAFDPAAIGAPAPARRPLKKLLVTGDSLSTPLDLELARRLSARGVKVVRDPHLGSGISKTDLIDWGRLAVTQTKAEKPDAVVLFIGANEGFPMKGPAGKDVQCCSADWAAVYANRARQMLDTYRRAGATRVYWITVPTPRDPARQKIERVVNAAIAVAAQPWRRSVRVLDTVPIFTPGERYRDTMALDGSEVLVRESDGIHLNARGAAELAGHVIDVLGRDFAG